MRSLRMLCATAGFLTLSTLGGVTAARAADSLSLALQPNAQTFNINYQRLEIDGITVTNVANHPVRAGYFTAQLNGAPPSFTVYCVDIDGDEKNPQAVTVTPVTVPGSNAHYDGTIGTFKELTEAAWLMDTFDDISGPNGVLADASGINGAAMQAAIWNVIDGDADFDVSSGVFNMVTDGNINFGAMVTQANFYLSALQTALGLGGTHGVDPGTLYSAINRTADGQDVLRGRTPDTPEGASLLMFLPGLIPVAVGLRRRRNKPAGK